MFDELNPEQRAAVDHRGTPLLVVAGAGTGKTKTLAARVASLLAEGTPPERILLLTFTRRAAAEMLARVAAATDRRAAGQVWGGTFHATANRLLRHHGAAIGLPDGFTVLDQGDAAELLGVVRTEQGLGERGRRFPRKETLAAAYSAMVNAQLPLAEVLAGHFPWCADHVEDFKVVFRAYTDRKRRHRVLDFDDLLLFWRAMTATPATGDVLRARFDHLLVDEYQDTNAIQADIVAGMAGPGTQVTVVGDDAQAIYGFRSATVANLLGFEQRFHGAATVTLEQNYRSSPAILAAANAVLAQSDELRPKRLWSDRPAGPPPRLVTCADEGAQSRHVADAVLEARERGLDLREQAVLFRAAAHSQALELELARRDIPFVKFGGLAYLEAAHVKDLLALLRVLDNPADVLAWHRVLSMIDHVGPATVRRLLPALGLEDRAPTGPDAVQRLIDGNLSFPPAAAAQVAELAAALADCRRDPSPAEQVERLVPFCSLAFPGRYHNAAARLADLGQLAATARSHRDRSTLLVELTLDPPQRTGDLAGPPHLDDDWLTLSTIHSAKGCEWRAVHLIHAADGNLPSDLALADPSGLAEELRLLYVALTRARDELTITFPLRYHVHRHGRDDRHHLAQLSRFLEPLGDLLEPAEAPAAAPGPGLDGTDVLVPVGIADEVDAALHALWE